MTQTVYMRQSISKAPYLARVTDVTKVVRWTCFDELGLERFRSSFLLQFAARCEQSHGLCALLPYRRLFLKSHRHR